MSLACTQPAPISGVVKVGPGRMAKAGCLSRSCHTISHEMCMSVRLTGCMSVCNFNDQGSFNCWNFQEFMFCRRNRLHWEPYLSGTSNFICVRVTKVFVRVTSMVKIVCEISRNLILILYRNRDFSFYLCEKKKGEKGSGLRKCMYICACLTSIVKIVCEISRQGLK